MKDQEKRKALLNLAMAFWRESEAPSDDDWETLFLFLIDREESKLRKFVNQE